MSNWESYRDFLKTRFKELGLEGYSFYNYGFPLDVSSLGKKINFTNVPITVFEESDKDEHDLLLASALHEAGHRNNLEVYIYSLFYLFLFGAIPTLIIMLVTRLLSILLFIRLFVPCGFLWMHGTAWARRNMKTISNKLPPRPPSVFWKYEYRADDFAKRLGYGGALADVLILLDKNDEIENDELDEPSNIQKLIKLPIWLFYYLISKPLDNSLDCHPPTKERVKRLLNCD